MALARAFISHVQCTFTSAGCNLIGNKVPRAWRPGESFRSASALCPRASSVHFHVAPAPVAPAQKRAAGPQTPLFAVRAAREFGERCGARDHFDLVCN